MLERNNKFANVGRVQFIKLVLNVFQLLTYEKLHCAIITIIKQMPSQEGSYLHTSKKPQIEYFKKRWKVVITRRKMVVMMETMVARNQIEKSNLTVSWTKDGA